MLYWYKIARSYDYKEVELQSIPLLSEYGIKLLTYQKTRAKKWISFSNPCIGYLLHGTAEFWLNGQSYTAHEGDLIYIAAETEY